jgi:hypothetical protein
VASRASTLVRLRRVIVKERCYLSAKSADVVKLVDDGIWFSDIFETEAMVAGAGATQGFKATHVDAATVGECPRLKPGMELTAPRLENRRYPATTELRRIEGITYDPTGHFDIVADDMPIQVASTRPQDHDAWLALDRNGSGVIDDGSELLGEATTDLQARRGRQRRDVRRRSGRDFVAASAS